MQYCQCVIMRTLLTFLYSGTGYKVSFDTICSKFNMSSAWSCSAILKPCAKTDNTILDLCDLVAHGYSLQVCQLKYFICLLLSGFLDYFELKDLRPEMRSLKLPFMVVLFLLKKIYKLESFDTFLFVLMMYITNFGVKMFSNNRLFYNEIRSHGMTFVKVLSPYFSCNKSH